MLMRLDLSGPLARYRLGRLRLRLRLARYWQAHGDLDEAARHAGRALRLLDGSPVERSGEVMLAVAEIECDRCEYASAQARLTTLVDQLDDQPAMSSTGRLLLTRALTGLGDAHRRSGRYAHAIQTLQRACELLDEADAAQPDLLAAALTTLAITHKEVGEFERAQQLYARVEQIRQDAGADNGQLADLHHNLAGLAYARQRYPLAERHARQAVALRRAAGADAVSLAADRAVLAAVLAALRQVDQARLHLDQALAACAAARPPRRYEVAVQLHQLAALDQACGHPQRSEQRYRQALAIKEDLLGPDHPEIAVVANNLGTLLHQQQRTTEAVDLFRRALTVAERRYPPGHPTTTGIVRNLDALA
jgi:tetratricopeptide (TPR) repeat protein